MLSKRKKQKVCYDELIMKFIIMLEELSEKQHDVFCLVMSELPYYVIKTISDVGNDRIKQLCKKNQILDKKVWLYGIGCGEFGRLGDGDESKHNVLEPFPIIVNTNSIKQVSSSYSYTMFVTNDDKLYGMGNGYDGRLGDGEDSYHLVATPKHIFNNVKQVSAGYSHTMFIGSKIK